MSAKKSLSIISGCGRIARARLKSKWNLLGFFVFLSILATYHHLETQNGSHENHVNKYHNIERRLFAEENIEDVGKERLVRLRQVLEEAKPHIERQKYIQKTNKDWPICDRYQNESKTLKTTFHAWTREDTPLDDITLVTVMSLDKFKVLKKVLTHWPGPVSIGYYSGGDATGVVETLENHTLTQRKYVELSVVTGGFEFIPINWLRQVALDQVKTKFVVLLDADLVPSITLYDNLIKMKDNYVNEPKALVIPAFELPKERGFVFPKTKDQMLMHMRTKTVRQFLIDEFPPSYEPTNYRKWKYTSNLYPVIYKKSFEPYIFADKEMLPPYDVRFHGRFYNKIAFFCQVHRKNFTFLVMPNDFCIHYPHSRRLILTKYMEHQTCSRKLAVDCPGIFGPGEVKKKKRKRRRRD